MTTTNQIAQFVDRALLEERSGNWATALQNYEAAYALSVAERRSEDLLDVIIRKAHCYRLSSQNDLASDYFELAFTLAELQKNMSVAGRALNGLAILKQHGGDIEGADQSYVEAREYAIRAGDALLIGQIEQNRGILANIRGNLTDALARYLSGLRHLEEAGDVRTCALVLNNLGMLHVDLHKLDEAADYFDRALEITREVSDVVTAGIIHLNRTEMFIARGERDLARISCDEAFEIASRLDDRPGKAEALKFYGVIYRETGKLHLSETHLRQAIHLIAGYDPLLEAETQRELARTLRALNQNRGALEALNRAHVLFTALQASHDQADVNQKITKLEDDFLSLVRSWGESIEAKDRYTSGHCQRVADYACRIAEEVGVSLGEMTWFRMGAFLHDVGKTEVPAEILNKPGRLTDEERLIMERHTVIGDEILAPVEFPWDIRPMVRSHHERWDGRGYPDRLVEEAIPFTARILRIADIFDALTTARSYRKPLTPEEAFQIMEEDEGSFDPELFRTFRNLFPELAERARRAHEQASHEAPSIPS